MTNLNDVKKHMELYEIFDKRLNVKIVIPKKDYKKLNIIISEGQIWININRVAGELKEVGNDTEYSWR